MNYAWSQIANPVAVSEKKTRNADGLLIFSDHRDRIFDGDEGSEASFSNVLDGMMTKNGVGMQVIINITKVKDKIVLIERSLSYNNGIYFQSLLQLAFWAVMNILPESFWEPREMYFLVIKYNINKIE